jgi:5-formyltetrahydrofolate cyclo-ligase
MTRARQATDDSASDAERVATAKSTLRAAMRAAVAAIPPARAAWRARRIEALALQSPLLAGTGLVLAYRALPDEIDIAPLVARLASRGVHIAFPSVDARRGLQLIEPADLADDSAWTRDRFGVAAPRADARGARIVQPRELDAVLVPGRAFSRDGARLGRGKGFYDALLARLRPDARRATLGVCHREQLVDAVPEAAHDRRVAAVVSDAGLVACLAALARARRADDGSAHDSGSARGGGADSGPLAADPEETR